MLTAYPVYLSRLERLGENPTDKRADSPVLWPHKIRDLAGHKDIQGNPLYKLIGFEAAQMGLLLGTVNLGDLKTEMSRGDTGILSNTHLQRIVQKEAQFGGLPSPPINGGPNY